MSKRASVGVWVCAAVSVAAAGWPAGVGAQTTGAEEISLTEVAEDAQGTPAPGGPYPRFGSLKKPEVNIRSGPGNQYPILWVYRRAWYPVQLLTRYDNYYKIRDAEAEEGWVHVNMISKRATGLVSGRDPAPLLKKPEPGARRVARLAGGVVVAIKGCEGGYCEVEVIPSGEEGYVAKTNLEMID